MSTAVDREGTFCSAENCWSPPAIGDRCGRHRRRLSLGRSWPREPTRRGIPANQRPQGSLRSPSQFGEGLSTGVRGAISELLVSADLLERNLPVFRALSQSCPCDLAVLHEGRTLRVEVRTVAPAFHRTGHLTCPLQDKDYGRFDVLAVVVGQAVYYFPDLFSADGPAPVPDRIGPAFLQRLKDWGLWQDGRGNGGEA